MHPLLLFASTTLASTIGSLQAGLVNTAVLANTLRYGKRAGERMAIGGAIPEFLYAAVAFHWAERLQQAPALQGGLLERIAGTVLIAFGLYLIFWLKPFTAEVKDPPARGGIRKGILIGLMNPQLLVFWCGVRLGLGMLGVEATGWWHLIAFAGGAMVGALLLLLFLVRMGLRLQQWARPNLLRNLFRVLGTLLVGAGAWAWWTAALAVQ